MSHQNLYRHTEKASPATLPSAEQILTQNLASHSLRLESRIHFPGNTAKSFYKAERAQNLKKKMTRRHSCPIAFSEHKVLDSYNARQKKPADCSRCQVTSCWKRTRLASAPGSGEAAGTSAGLMSGLLARLPAPHSPGSALFRPGASPRSQWESLCRVSKDLKRRFPSQKGRIA